jgi:hypothetical protein
MQCSPLNKNENICIMSHTMSCPYPLRLKIELITFNWSSFAKTFWKCFDWSLLLQTLDLAYEWKTVGKLKWLENFFLSLFNI